MPSVGAVAPVGTVTVVFTDVEGSTERWERDPAGMRGALAVHDSVLRAAIAAHGGYEVKTIGDAFMVAFAQVADAARFCLAVQAHLAAAAWPSGPLRVRMGMHAGAPICQLDPHTGRMDYFGPVVNKAARVQAAAHGGQVVASDAARCPEVGRWVALGAHGLKGLEGHHELWQLGEGAFPRVRTVDPRRTNLPAQVDAFVGRQLELGELRARICGGARLLTLVGTGGAGKTRLVQRFAAEALADLVESAWVCDLADARAEDDLLRLVAAALDVPLGVDAARQLGSAIDGRGRCLLVLDSFETVGDAGAEVLARWVDAARAAVFVVTSRRPLRLRGEVATLLPPLAEADGIGLLLARCPGLDAGDPHVRAIVAELDGLPLAIELAAARLRALSPADVLTRLADRFRLLTTPAVGVPARHRALEAAFNGSWALLSPAARSAFAQLAVFDGGATLSSAEEVLELDGWVIDAVSELVEHCFVRLEGDRYRLSPSIREYAVARLAESGAREATERRHGAIFARLGAPDALAVTDLATERRLAAELDNLGVACRRACARDDAPIAVATALAAARVLGWRGPLGAGLVLLDLAASVPKAHRAAELSTARAHLLRISGRGREAVEASRAAVRAARVAGDPGPLAWALAQAGASATDVEDPDAEGLLDEALRTAQAVGDVRAVAHVRSNQAVRSFHRGAVDAAHVHLEAALSAARTGPDRRHLGLVLGNLGALHLMRRGSSGARELLLEALEVARESGDRVSASHHLCNLGVEATRTGSEDPIALYEAAVTIDREIGTRANEANALLNLGVALGMAGRREECGAAYRRSLSLARDLSDRRTLLKALSNLANFEQRAGRLAAARALFDEGLEVARAAGNTSSEARLLCGLAHNASRAGDDDLARSLVEAASRVLEVAPNREESFEVETTRAAIAVRARDAATARAALARAESFVDWPASQGQAISDLRAEIGILEG